ncbi:MAG: hypothetical protein K8T10_15215 [Candidatus Eremiobacteraeota bacterium]|nr:hypothetical protein [Candidatus Eremiobacteraeota bacterium]
MTTEENPENSDTTEETEDQSKKKHNQWFQTLKENFPWKNFTIGLLVPKLIFYTFFHYGNILAGTVVALVWCVGVVLFDYIRSKKIGWFAIIAASLILVRLYAILRKDDPTAYLVVDSLDNMLFGLAFLISLLFPRPLMQIFVEMGDYSKIPEILIKSPYYRKAWAIITAVWGSVMVIEALFIYITKFSNPRISLYIDIFSGWPTWLLLFSFCMWLPRWYWTKNWKKIENSS